MITGDNDTCDKFFAGINDTGEQFFPGVLRILCKFFIEPPPDAQREERQGTGKEKGREGGIWDWCILLSGVNRPPPPPLPYLARPTSPACGHDYQGRRYSGEPPPSPHITHTPFQQFEATAVDL
jgi:hypothetical protein